jgi:hypothetical protein
VLRKYLRYDELSVSGFVVFVKEVERCFKALKNDESGSSELQLMLSGFHPFFE